MLSQNKNEFINSLILFSQNRIKNADDISALFDSYLHEKKIFDDFIFTAKYLNGLGRILQKGFVNIDPEKLSTEKEQDSQRKIRNEYKNQLEKFIATLKGLVSKFPKNEQTRFNDKYLAMDRNSMISLTTLIYDLCWVKKYINSEKEN